MSKNNKVPNKNKQGYFFGQTLPKNWFGASNFRNSESAPPRYYECQFLGKTNNFEFFGLNFGKLSNYVKYFGSCNVEVVTK